MTNMEDVVIRRVIVEICEGCLKGQPGQCHAPGCLFCRFCVEDTPQPLGGYILEYLDGTRQL